MIIMILSSSRARHWFGPSVHMHGYSQFFGGGLLGVFQHSLIRCHMCRSGKGGVCCV
jgi:hypothetical protein